MAQKVPLSLSYVPLWRERRTQVVDDAVRRSLFGDWPYGVRWGLEPLSARCLLSPNADWHFGAASSDGPVAWTGGETHCCDRHGLGPSTGHCHLYPRVNRHHWVAIAESGTRLCQYMHF